MRLRRLALAAGVALAGLLLGSTSAWAYFSTTGAGSGRAAAGQLTVEVLSSGPDGSLLPGQTGDASLRLHNPQAVPITLLAVLAAGDPVADNGCTPTGLSFTNQSQLDVVIPALDTVVIPLPGSVSLSLDAAAACQGTDFSIPVTVTVRS